MSQLVSVQMVSAGEEIAELLGLRGTFRLTKDARPHKHGVWHRVRTLLATLEVVLAAERRGVVASILITAGIPMLNTRLLYGSECARGEVE